MRKEVATGCEFPLEGQLVVLAVGWMFRATRLLNLVCSDRVPVTLLASGSLALSLGEASSALCGFVTEMVKEAGTHQLLYEGRYSWWFNGCRLTTT